MIDHLFSLGIHAFYVGEVDVGRRACERLLALPELPPEIELMTRENRLWYSPRLDELAGTRYQRFDIDPAHEGWSLFNPTILAREPEGDLVAIVRSSNYRIVEGRYEIPPADNGTIRTQNILVMLRPDLSVVSARVIADPEYDRTPYPVDGLEDCRLRHTPDGIGVSAVIRNASPWDDGACRQATARLDLEAAAFTDLRILDGVRVQEHEKNWMPIVGRPAWLHSCSFEAHTVTVEETEPGRYDVFRRSGVPPIARSWRGGGQLSPWMDGYLGVIHEVAPCGGQRAYEHRLVWLDNSLRLKLASAPFHFLEAKAIEFAAGLAVHGGRLVISFGVRDAEAWLVDVSLDDAWQMLKPLSSPGTAGSTPATGRTTASSSSVTGS